MKKNNLSAFPDNISSNGTFTQGMTLLDYFAARAMQGELACQDGNYIVKMKDFSVLAEWSYDLAEAMLTERIKHL